MAYPIKAGENCLATAPLPLLKLRKELPMKTDRPLTVIILDGDKICYAAFADKSQLRMIIEILRSKFLAQ